jgi:hypothetical protein
MKKIVLFIQKTLKLIAKNDRKKLLIEIKICIKFTNGDRGVY